MLLHNQELALSDNLVYDVFVLQYKLVNAGEHLMPPPNTLAGKSIQPPGRDGEYICSCGKKIKKLRLREMEKDRGEVVCPRCGKVIHPIKYRQ